MATKSWSPQLAGAVELPLPDLLGEGVRAGEVPCLQLLIGDDLRTPEQILEGLVGQPPAPIAAEACANKEKVLHL